MLSLMAPACGRVDQQWRVVIKGTSKCAWPVCSIHMWWASTVYIVLHVLVCLLECTHMPPKCPECPAHTHWKITLLTYSLTHMHTHAHICTHTLHTHTYMYTRTYTHTTYTHIRTQTHTRTLTHVHVHTDITVAVAVEAVALAAVLRSLVSSCRCCTNS